MITLCIALSVGFGGFAASYWGADIGIGWSIFLGFVSFGIVQATAGIIVQRRVKADMAKVQAIMAEGQKRLQQKMQRWQLRPPGSVQMMQREMFNDTKAVVRDALAATSLLEKYRPWVPMMDRQIATARIQLNWSVKNFKAVDELMPKALLVDPTMRCIKMARMQMLGSPVAEIRKIYDKGVRRARYNDNVLLAATMSWIELARGDADAAFKTLTAALKKSDNETLKRNHECLMNNRPAHFSNSGIGDMWYSLHLEEPRMHAPRQRSVYR